MKVEAPSFHSQNDEDRWLAAYFEGKRSGFYVEVGAYDGVNFSNTFHFEQIGWTGILVEPDPEKAALCRKNRPQSVTYGCAMVEPGAVGEITFHQVAEAGVFSTTNLSDAHRSRLVNKGMSWREIKVPARTLDSVLEEVAPKEIDFVSVDVEGGELSVLSGFSIRRWNPEIVIVESNAKVRAPAIRDYFVASGYAYRHSIDVNDFYVRTSGPAVLARLIDTSRYMRHRIQRRAARIRAKIARTWRKHVLHEA